MTSNFTRNNFSKVLLPESLLIEANTKLLSQMVHKACSNIPNVFQKKKDFVYFYPSNALDLMLLTFNL